MDQSRYALVSVIIPVYNVERYLPECLDSVCNQTYKNLEIIVVDDESPDSCGSIADDYAAKDKRIKVLHIKNAGAAGARNRGLEKSTGDYIMFIDSDDWIDRDCIALLYDAMKDNDYQVVQCQYMDEYLSCSKEHRINQRKGRYSSLEFARDMLINWEDILACNKLFKRSAIGDVRYEEGHCIDDEFFTYKVIMQVSDIMVVPHYLYHYRKRSSSAMGDKAKKEQRISDQLDFATQRYKPLCKAFPEIRKDILIHLINLLIYVILESGGFYKVYIRAKFLLAKYSIILLFQSDIPLSCKKSAIVTLIKPKICFKRTFQQSLGTDDYYE